MGVEYVQSRNCKVKRDLGVNELVGRIKARSQAALLIKRLQKDGQDPETASITRVVQYPSGPVSEKVTVAELRDAGHTLDAYEPRCKGCTANFRETAFGCCGFLNYPILLAEENWLLSRLPESMDTTAGVYLRKVFERLKIDGAAVGAMRDQAGLFFETARAPERHWDYSGGTITVNTDQIMEFMFYSGPIVPSHAAMLALVLGLLPHDIAPEAMQAILQRPETLQDHLVIDAAALSALQGTHVGMFLLGVLSAAINRENLTIDA